MDYPSAVNVTKKISSACNKITSSNQESKTGQQDIVGIMSTINSFAYIFSKMENEFNSKNKFNFGYLPFYVYKCLINNKPINNIIDLYIHKCNYYEDNDVQNYTTKLNILITVITIIKTK